MREKLIITHNAGFFSCAGVRLSEIYKFYIKNKTLPSVDSSRQWNDYKDDLTIDITYKFFKKEKNKDIEFVPFQLIKECENITQFFDYQYLNYEKIKFFIDEYFSPSEEILQIKNFLLKKYDLDLNNTITIFYRGNDKNVETNVPSYDEMLLKLREVKNKYPDHKILVQTDELEFSQFIKDNFNDCILFEESKMMSKNTTYGRGSIQYTLGFGEKVKYGQLFLAITLIMSESSKIILPSGNIAMWICLFRGNAKNVYQHINIKNDGFIHKDSVIINNWINHG